MRTKKRAKSVSFGKKETAPKPVEEEVKKAEAADSAKSSVEPKEELSKKDPVIVEADSKDTKEEPKKEEEASVEETKAEEKEESKEEEVVSNAIETKADAEVAIDEKTEKVDPLEKDLESLKEPEEEISVTEETKETKEPEEKPKETVADVSEEPKPATTTVITNKKSDPFTADSAFSRIDGLYDKKKKSGLPFFLLVAAVAFVLGLAVMAGADYFMKQSNVKLPNVASLATNPTPTPTPTKVPEPTEEPKKDVDLSAVSVRVLNGSGVKGEAAKVKALLTKAGFNVVGTGNADEDTYKKTEIIAKKTVDKEVLKQLDATLSEMYVVASPTAPTGSQTSDIVVIIGSSTK